MNFKYLSGWLILPLSAITISHFHPCPLNSTPPLLTELITISVTQRNRNSQTKALAFTVTNTNCLLLLFYPSVLGLNRYNASSWLRPDSSSTCSLDSTCSPLVKSPNIDNFSLCKYNCFLNSNLLIFKHAQVSPILIKTLPGPPKTFKLHTLCFLSFTDKLLISIPNLLLRQK